MRTCEGLLKATGGKIAIVSARFNHFIVDQLVAGAEDALKRHQFNDDQLVHFKVPGAFEIPVMVKRILASQKYDGVIALGAVIRGATPHFDYVSAEVSKGIASVSIEYGVPVSFGVLTTDNIDQAIERAGTKSGNKGFEAAVSLIEMLDLFQRHQDEL